MDVPVKSMTYGIVSFGLLLVLMTSIHPFRPAYTRLFIHSSIFPKQLIYCGPSTYQAPFFQWPLKYKTFPSHQKSLVSRSGSHGLPRSLIRELWIFFSAYLSVCSLHRDSCKRSLSRGTWNSWFHEPSQAEIQTDGLTILRVKVKDFLNDLHKGSSWKWGCRKCLKSWQG